VCVRFTTFPPPHTQVRFFERRHFPFSFFFLSSPFFFSWTAGIIPVSPSIFRQLCIYALLMTRGCAPSFRNSFLLHRSIPFLWCRVILLFHMRPTPLLFEFMARHTHFFIFVFTLFFPSLLSTCALRFPSPLPSLSFPSFNLFPPENMILDRARPRRIPPVALLSFFFYLFFSHRQDYVESPLFFLFPTTSSGSCSTARALVI